MMQMQRPIQFTAKCSANFTRAVSFVLSDKIAEEVLLDVFDVSIKYSLLEQAITPDHKKYSI